MTYSILSPALFGLFLSLVATLLAGVAREKSHVLLSLTFLLFIICIFYSVQNSRFIETDWVQYIQPADYLKDSNIIGGDYFFWGPLICATEKFNEFELHCFFKIVGILFFYLALRTVHLSKIISIYVTIIWGGTISFCLASDWYIRQGFANNFFIIGFLGLLHTKTISTESNKNQLSCIFFVLLLILSVLIHFGMIILILITLFSYWVSVRFIKFNRILTLDRACLNKLIGLILLLVIGSFFITIICSKHLKILIPSYLYDYGAEHTPISDYILMALIIYNLMLFRKLYFNKEMYDYKNLISVGIYFNFIVLFVLSISIGISLIFNYVLRINMFKEVYICIDLGLLLQIFFKTRTKKLSDKRLKLVFLNSGFLTLLNIYNFFI